MNSPNYGVFFSKNIYLRIIKKFPVTKNISSAKNYAIYGPE